MITTAFTIAIGILLAGAIFLIFIALLTALTDGPSEHEQKELARARAREKYVLPAELAPDPIQVGPGKPLKWGEYPLNWSGKK